MLKYGTGSQAKNICHVCRRGGAREFDHGGRVHHACRDHRDHDDALYHWCYCVTCCLHFKSVRRGRLPSHCTECGGTVEYDGHGTYPGMAHINGIAPNAQAKRPAVGGSD